jgi:hypothetical protein
MMSLMTGACNGVIRRANGTDDVCRDKRIFSTGCAGLSDSIVWKDAQLTFPIDENSKLTDCYYEKKDWRACKQEVSRRRFSRGVLSAAEMLPRHQMSFQNCELTTEPDGSVSPVLAKTGKR